MKTLEQMAEEAGMVKVGDLWCSEAGNGGTDEPTMRLFAALVAERCADIAETRLTGAGAALGILAEFPKP